MIILLNVLLTTIFFTSSVNGIWDTLHAHANHGGFHPLSQFRGRSSTDANGQVLGLAADSDHLQPNTVTPSSFSDIFTGQMQNVVLVKKADPLLPKLDTFVPLPSNPPTLQGPSTTVATTTTTAPSTMPATSSYSMTTTSSSAYVTPVTSWPTFSSTTTTQVPPPIVVLSRQRFSPPSGDLATLFVTPSGPPKSSSSSSTLLENTPPRPRSSPDPPSSPSLISSTASGVPASGDIPKSWTINNYDPRRNRISIVKDNDHQLFLTGSPPSRSPAASSPPMMEASSAISRPTFVTPLPAFQPSTAMAELRPKVPSTATEAMISRLRKDYKKRRQLMEKSASLRRSDFGGPTVVPKSTPSSTSTTMTSSTLASSTSEYTKGPSIRFEMAENSPAVAEDRYLVISPSSDYPVVDHQAAESTTTPYSTTISSSYLPPITTESHAYKEVHYVEKSPVTSTTTATSYQKPSTLIHPPTSLTPPFAKGQVYAVRPTVPSSSTTLITTQGALLLPKNPKVPTFVTPIHSSASTFPLENSYPAIIVVQQGTQEAEKDMGQEEKKMTITSSTTEAAPPLTTTPMSITTDTTTTATTEDGSQVVFPTAAASGMDVNAADTTLLANLVTNYDEMEITERIHNNGQVIFNDTQIDPKRGVQQSINLKINVIVENSDSTEENSDDDAEYFDSVPKATSTSPSIPQKKANYIKKLLPPLSYTSSSSFRSEAPAAPVAAPPPATANDYMYDSELDMLDDYYYYETDDNDQPKRSLEKEVEITDKELFELYDDLSEILEDMEASLATKSQAKPKWPPKQQKPSVRDEKQNIYEFIRSKPLKMKPKRYNAQPAELALVHQVDQLTHQVDDVTADQLMTYPYSSMRDPDELIKPIIQSPQVKAKPKPFKFDPRKRKRRRRRKKNFLKMGSVKSYGHLSHPTPAPSHYNLTGDLIPDLREVSKPSDWNVRDFTPWQEIFFPRLGVMPITPELTTEARPEKHRKPEVTFDKLLKTNPNRGLDKFSRLIRHDRAFAQRRSRSDDYPVEEEPWTQYSHYTRVPRDDSFFKTEPENYYHPLPSFDISFDEWLAEAGVSSSKLRHFRNQKPFWNNPEGVLHR